MDILEAVEQVWRNGISKSDQEEISSIIAECQAKIEYVSSDLARKIPVNIEVSFNLTGAVAGRAIGKDKIRLNAELFRRNKDEFLKQTIPHEYAHIVVHNVYPGASHHGWEWQKVMNYLGLEAKRCHDIDISNLKRVVKRQTFEAACSCKSM